MPLEFRFVDEDELRRLFNDAQYLDRVETGEWREEVLYDGLPGSHSGQPEGTRSLRVRWVSQTGQHMATVHYYRKRDWTLSGSGLPDPKQVRIGNVVYKLNTRKID